MRDRWRSVAVNNSALIHPDGFYVMGFVTLPFIHLYFIFLIFVYIVTFVFNILVIYIIVSDRRLHVPKFLAVANLAVIDLALNTFIIPNVIKIFLAKVNFVSFNLCLVQMFVYYTLFTLESFALAVLAYDRFIAICFPLHQHSINTMWSMFFIIVVIWAFGISINLFSTVIITRLSFCGSVNVFSYFCDYSPVFRLACNDNSLQWTTATALSLLTLLGPLSFIILSYASILVAVFRMKTLDSRIKALATCTEHLILVAIFYIPILIIFMCGLFGARIDPDVRVLSLSMASCFPPCLNPIIYSLKTKEIKTKAFALFSWTNVSV